MRSPYRGAERNNDFLPLFIYESERFSVSSYRAALKYEAAELFVKRRLEGFASDRVPAGLAGAPRRENGTDLGIAWSWRLGPGTAYAELMRDMSDASDGSELRLGYRYEGWWGGRMRLRPYFTAAWRDAKLNNYYYAAPGYEPGAGVDLELGTTAAYRLNANWQVLGGLALLRTASGVRASPAVEDRSIAPSVTLGLLYSISPQPAPPGERKPLILRAYFGASTDCDFLPIITLRCLSRHTQDPTNIYGFDIGQRLLERVNGWPLDIAGFVGVLQHDERGLQPDSWQVNAYLKAYFYGFPWRERLRTRLGLGSGIAYASRIPFSEARDQALRVRDTSKFLLYLDPSVDLNLGDLLRSRSLRDTYVGFGGSHRSGMFGWSRLFNNVNGGSNYLFAYVETSF
jgi:outer membrane protein